MCKCKWYYIGIKKEITYNLFSEKNKMGIWSVRESLQNTR